jgi:mRNA-degrading endonuclease RelE of RelBE toxin-antitoxin system
MKLVLNEQVNTALAGLGQDDRSRVQTWLQYLRNWDTDKFAKENSIDLAIVGRSVYVFRTSTGLRIFFTVDQSEDTITVLDIATKETIISSGQIAGANNS